VPSFPCGRSSSFYAIGKRVFSKTDLLFSVSHHLHLQVTGLHALAGDRALTHRRRRIMNTKSKIAVAMIVGAAFGAAATQGLHAQAKLKAYSVGELEPLDPAAMADYLPAARKAIEGAHGRALRTAAGRVVSIDGAPAPKSAAIVEWDSLDDAVAFYKSKAWTDLAPQRDKAQKAIRRYVVEVEK
jgi:uncharacterized protein (DUF1330 family)